MGSSEKAKSNEKSDGNEVKWIVFVLRRRNVWRGQLLRDIVGVKVVI
jgi:hypothetical protein